MRRVGVSELRTMNAKYLREIAEPIEICSRNEPLRVLVPYAMYMKWQRVLADYQAIRKGQNG